MAFKLNLYNVQYFEQTTGSTSVVQLLTVMKILNFCRFWYPCLPRGGGGAALGHFLGKHVRPENYTISYMDVD